MEPLWSLEVVTFPMVPAEKIVLLRPRTVTVPMPADSPGLSNHGRRYVFEELIHRFNEGWFSALTGGAGGVIALRPEKS